MYAIMATGGKQYLVKEGDIIKIEKLELNEGEKVTFDQILMLEKDGKYFFGQPSIQDSFVEAKILRHGKAKKIIVLKYKPKKRYEKKTGHRQLFTEIKIEKITSS